MLSVLPATRSNKLPDLTKLARFAYLDRIIRIADRVEDANDSGSWNHSYPDLRALNLAELSHNSNEVGHELAAVIKTVAAGGTLVEVSDSNGHLCISKCYDEHNLPQLLARSIEANNSLLEHENKRVVELAEANVGILARVLKLYQQFSEPAPQA